MRRVSRFQQVMEALPRSVFDETVARNKGNKYRETFRCWDQFSAMCFAQLSGCTSLRKLVASFNEDEGTRQALGVGWLSRSTLADANCKVKLTIFDEVARFLMSGTCRHLRQQGRELLYLLDSTSISLTVRGMKRWTAAHRIRGTQGLKVHILAPQGDDTALNYIKITHPNVNDESVAQRLPLESGQIYVFDKGYCDYNWWHRIDEIGSRFVTRFKSNTAVKPVPSNPIPPSAQGIILADEIVTFSRRVPRGGYRNHYYAQPLRRITINRPDHPEGKPLILVTNDLDSPAMLIGDYYRCRWAIELLFKWIKQHLQVKKYLGENERAIRFQILVAMITYLLLLSLKQTHRLELALYLILEKLQHTLWIRDDLIAALEHPSRKRPPTPKSQPRPKKIQPTREPLAAVAA